MGQYDDVECTLATCLLHDVTKRGCDHHDAVKKFEIRLKTRLYAITPSRFFVEHTIEDAPLCDAASRETEAIVAELTVHTARKVIELLV